MPDEESEEDGCDSYLNYKVLCHEKYEEKFEFHMMCNYCKAYDEV